MQQRRPMPHIRFVEPDHVRRPLGISDSRKKRRIGSQNHHIRVFLNARQESCFRKRPGTVLVPMHGQEKELRKEGIYISISFDEKDGEYILKAVNAAKGLPAPSSR